MLRAVLGTGVDTLVSYFDCCEKHDSSSLFIVFIERLYNKIGVPIKEYPRRCKQLTQTSSELKQLELILR
jgi:hypothetical protein